MNISTFLKRLNTEIENKGLSPALLNFIKRRGNRIKIVGLTKETEIILKTKPVLIISTHKDRFNVIMSLASLPKRNDIFLLATSYFSQFGSGFKKHLIPLFIHHKFKENKLNLLLKTIVMSFLKQDNISKEEAHTLNIGNINLASSKINEGNAVVIFPDGVNTKSQTWENGIGYLIKDVNITDAYYVFVYVESSKFSSLRYFPFIPYLFKPLEVTFGKTYSINTLKNKRNNPKEITKLLHNEYWAPTNDFKIKKLINIPLFHTNYWKKKIFRI